MIDDAVAACDSVEAPGPDSQKYRDMCKDLFSMFKDMIGDLKGADLSDSNAAQQVTQKYLSQIMSKTSEAMKFMQELSDKYGITMPTTTTAGSTDTTDTTETEGDQGAEQ